MKVNIVSSYEELKAPGDLLWRGEPIDRCLFSCPCGCGSIIGLSVAANTSIAEPAFTVWQWDGNSQSPTITPSVLRLDGCKWHGFITNGQYVNA